MFRSTTIIRDLAIVPGYSYIDIKTFGKVISLIVMRWCGSMSQYGVCTVCCALQRKRSLQNNKGRFTRSMPCPCRAHAFPLPCRAVKDLIFVVPCIMLNSEIIPTRRINAIVASCWNYFTIKCR